ncbi:MAG: hypothetical protein DRQ78_11730 [Epsilonproteobacteria bacterium]|nr:MAG: hypothetical protein DRQ78_11730 [Campylobacterota bacterium]
MSNKLLEKLQKTQKDIINSVKKKLNLNSPFSTLTDAEIALVLAYRAKNLRIAQNTKQSTFSRTAKLSSVSTYANFEQKGTVSLVNFIKIMRNFGRLNELETLLKPTVSETIEAFDKESKKRVR